METWQCLLLLLLLILGTVSGYPRCFQAPRMRGLDQVSAGGLYQ